MSNNEQQSGGFELYHIPQQSRRDKLRFTAPIICSLNSYEQQEGEPATASTQISLTHNNNSINNQQEEGGCIGYLPLYDPSSLFPPDLLNTHPQGFSHLHHLFASSSSSEHQQPPSIIRATNQNPSSSSSNFLKEVSNTSNNNYFMATAFADPQYGSTLAALPGAQAQTSPTTENTNSNNNNGSSNFLLNREISHHSASAHELALYKPEPLNLHHQPQQGALSLTLSSSSASIHQTTNHNLTTNTSTFARYPAAPVGPFTGYASILTGSRYLRPAQLLLQEICDLQGQWFVDHHGSYSAGFKTGPDLSLLEPPPATENLRVLEDLVSVGDIGSSNSTADQRDRRVKSRLISMLDEVCRRYKQYYHQLQAVVASFESVPGLSNAAPFANLAFRAMSRQFRSLKSTITDQIQHLTNSPDDLSNMRIEGNNPKSNCSDKISLYGRRPLPISRSLENHQPVWRPQRGLPERAVSVLRAWLFEHFLHPYPTDTDKMMLAKQTGLSRSQVSNWFINARVRLWKPMVEEIHALETRQQQPHHQKASTSSQPNNIDHRQVASAGSPTYHNNYPSTSGLMRPPQDNIPPPVKRVRNEILDIPQMSLQYSGQLSAGHGVGGCDIGPGNSSLVGTSNVSLTLALHHQNSGGVGLSSDPYPSIGLAHRFGLNGGNEGCVIGPAFEGQNCHFPRDVIGAGNLLHDFVG